MWGCRARCSQALPRPCAVVIVHGSLSLTFLHASFISMISHFLRASFLLPKNSARKMSYAHFFLESCGSLKASSAVCFALQLNHPSVLWKSTRNGFCHSALWESAEKSCHSWNALGLVAAMHELELGNRRLHAPSPPPRPAMHMQ